MQDYPGQLNTKDRLDQRSSYATTVVNDSISLAAFNFVQDGLTWRKFVMTLMLIAFTGRA
jgi:hypothetical protein